MQETVVNQATNAAGETASQATSIADTAIEFLSTRGMEFGIKIIGAIAVWIIGGMIIKFVRKLVSKAINKSGTMDPTVSRFADSLVGILLKIVLIMAVLGIFGVQTTSFAAILAAAGVAIGMAWSGLLANFAAGIFLLILKPFKVGDLISANGDVGTVVEVGLFVTAIDTLDNVRTYIGNNKVFSEKIQNFTTNPHRRVDLKAQLAHGADHNAAIDTLKTKLAAIPNTVNTPDVHIVDFTLAGPVLCVRPYCHNDHYWDVYFATNKVIREELGKLGLPTPETHHKISKAS